MAAVNSIPFEHTPLLDPAAQLRLLKVSSSRNTRDVQEHLHCDITVCNINTKPRYIAVSYTWGDPDDTKTITVDGKLLTVRSNCWYVLWQACINNISSLLWIDAICINQCDNEEKSLQVAMMGSIYRNAEQVNVCLGPHSNNSRLLLDAAEEHAHFVEDKLQSYRTSGELSAILEPLQRRGRVKAGLPETAEVLTMSLFSQSVRAVLLAEMQTQEDFSRFSRESLEALTEARYCLTERAYFTRLWICQEILLGRRAILMVGDTIVNFEHLLDFESDIVGYCLRQKEGPHSGIEFDASQEFLSIVNIRNGWSLAGMGLLELTDIFSRFQCFDVRYRIFGMLGMVNWQGYPPMIPDYNKTAFDIGIEAISYMCPLLEENDAERDNMSWPIVSAKQIASALSLDATTIW